MQDLQLGKEIANVHASIVNFTPVDFLSPIWQSNISFSIRKIIYDNTTFQDKLREIHKCVHYSLVNNKEVIQAQSLWWAKHLEYANVDWENIQESSLVSDEFCTSINGKRFSPDLGRRLIHFNYIEKNLDVSTTNRLTVVELGAGYGGFPRLFKLKRPNCAYIIVDIPDTLAISYGYLKANFPDCTFKVITDANERITQSVIANTDFIFIPVGLDHVLEGCEIDFFMNTHSLGEMPNKAISHWMNFIQNKVHIKNAFMLNRFLNRTNPRESFRLAENTSSCLFDPNWNIKYWEFEPAFMRCPFHETHEAQCLLLIMQRNKLTNRSASELAETSKSYNNYVMQQDWYKFINRYNQFTNVQDILSSFIYPERVQDYTINGTLFYLWEAIRLSPNRESVSLMIQYLKYINVLGSPFEETTYYIDLLQKLAN